MHQLFLVSEQPVLLRGFEHVLRKQGFDIAGSCEMALLAREIGSATRNVAILLDITGSFRFPSLSDVHDSAPECPIILWADSDTLPLEFIFKSLEYGVRGVIQRTMAPEQVAESLRTAVLSARPAHLPVAGKRSKARKKVTLTPRQGEIVAFLREGLRNKEIAERMGITEGTVKIYLFRLFSKLSVRNRFELARCSLVDQLQTASTSAAAPPQTHAAGGQ